MCVSITKEQLSNRPVKSFEANDKKFRKQENSGLFHVLVLWEHYATLWEKSLTGMVFDLPAGTPFKILCQKAGGLYSMEKLVNNWAWGYRWRRSHTTWTCQKKKSPKQACDLKRARLNVDTCHRAVLGREPRPRLLPAQPLAIPPRDPISEISHKTLPVKVHHSRFVKTHLL